MIKFKRYIISIAIIFCSVYFIGLDTFYCMDNNVKNIIDLIEDGLEEQARDRLQQLHMQIENATPQELERMQSLINEARLQNNNEAFALNNNYQLENVGNVPNETLSSREILERVLRVIGITLTIAATAYLLWKFRNEIMDMVQQLTIDGFKRSLGRQINNLNPSQIAWLYARFNPNIPQA